MVCMFVWCCININEVVFFIFFFFFFQAEDGIRDLVRSRGLGDVYKRQGSHSVSAHGLASMMIPFSSAQAGGCGARCSSAKVCLLYTSDAADDLLCVDLGGRRIIKKKNQHKTIMTKMSQHILRKHNK